MEAATGYDPAFPRKTVLRNGASCLDDAAIAVWALTPSRVGRLALPPCRSFCPNRTLSAIA
nr:MAG TPA: hypothetical protein [Bacteriophage sp.]